MNLLTLIISESEMRPFDLLCDNLSLILRNIVASLNWHNSLRLIAAVTVLRLFELVHFINL